MTAVTGNYGAAIPGTAIEISQEPIEGELGRRFCSVRSAIRAGVFFAGSIGTASGAIGTIFYIFRNMTIPGGDPSYNQERAFAQDALLISIGSLIMSPSLASFGYCLLKPRSWATITTIDHYLDDPRVAGYASFCHYYLFPAARINREAPLLPPP